MQKNIQDKSMPSNGSIILDLFISSTMSCNKYLVLWFVVKSLSLQASNLEKGLGLSSPINKKIYFISLFFFPSKLTFIFNVQIRYVELMDYYVLISLSFHVTS